MTEFLQMGGDARVRLVGLWHYTGRRGVEHLVGAPPASQGIGGGAQLRDDGPRPQATHGEATTVTPRRQRMLLIGLVLAGVAVSATFAFRAFRENLTTSSARRRSRPARRPRGRSGSAGWCSRTACSASPAA